MARQEYPSVTGTFFGSVSTFGPFNLYLGNGNSTTVGPNQRMFITDINAVGNTSVVLPSSTAPTTTVPQIAILTGNNFCTAGKGYPCQQGQVPYCSTASATTNCFIVGYMEPILNQIALN